MGTKLYLAAVLGLWLGTASCQPYSRRTPTPSTNTPPRVAIVPATEQQTAVVVAPVEPVDTGPAPVAIEEVLWPEIRSALENDPRCGHIIRGIESSYTTPSARWQAWLQAQEAVHSLCGDANDHLSSAASVGCEDEKLAGHIEPLVKACAIACKRIVDSEDLRKTFPSQNTYVTAVERLKKLTIFFGTGGWELTEESKKRLRGFMKVYNGAAADRYLMVIGRASRRGRRDRNEEIALRRAVATREFLVEQGVSRQQSGYTVYDQDAMYFGRSDAAFLAPEKGVPLTQDSLNQSATVFIYECGDNVRKWLNEVN